jgi:hypothetical protein
MCKFQEKQMLGQLLRRLVAEQEWVNAAFQPFAD